MTRTASHRPLHESTPGGAVRCRQCMFPLDVREHRGGRLTYEHGALPPHVEAHTPVPEAIADDSDVLAMCDFCTTAVLPGLEWYVPSQSFTYQLEGMLPHNLVGDWAACPSCARDFNTGQLDAMYARWAGRKLNAQMVEVLARESDQHREWIMGLWRTLAEHYATGLAHPARVTTDGEHRRSPGGP